MCYCDSAFHPDDRCLRGGINLDPKGRAILLRLAAERREAGRKARLASAREPKAPPEPDPPYLGERDD